MCLPRARLLFPLACVVVACGPTGTNADPDRDPDPEDEACVPVLVYDDHDDDGYGDPATASATCDGPGLQTEGGDCDDDDDDVNPDAEEVPYDGADNDCADDTPDDDLDADGYPASLDCDDTDASASPAGTESAYDGVNNDCDGATADDDLDADGYPQADDCDDADARRRPDAIEQCDGLDNDCDGDVDGECGVLLQANARITAYSLADDAVTATVDVVSYGASDGDARDLCVTGDGRIAVYNGGWDAVLSVYDPEEGTWSHFDGEPFGGAGGNISLGGIACRDDYVFVTDLDAARTDGGILRFTLSDGSTLRLGGAGEEYLDLDVGLDGRLYTLQDYGDVEVYDPDSGDSLDVVPMPFEDIRGITADASGDLYYATWDEDVVWMAADGTELARVHLGSSWDLVDVGIAPDGRVVTSGRFGDYAVLDAGLAAYDVYSHGTSTTFSAFGAL